MSSSLKYEESALLERIERGGFRTEFSAQSEDDRFLLVGAAPR